MIKETAEFKIRFPGLRWEDTPVIATLVTSSLLTRSRRIQAHDHAKAIANLVQREVRWNWQDSLQGHYVGSGYRAPAHLRVNDRQRDLQALDTAYLEDLEPAADLDAVEQWMWEHGGPTYQETPDLIPNDCPS